ncbi:hypothetical protein IV203_034332 [Nitzschia inconspicua]|uniref:Uncharacterized protein n=1 Tax=Nitzschia inconspicua TaxID=303405 RepID=A0A9K3M4J3_9STRA|nr:hypothetical protein IV203_034332 [Nitzschia inconspicua]
MLATRSKYDVEEDGRINRDRKRNGKVKWILKDDRHASHIRMNTPEKRIFPNTEDLPVQSFGWSGLAKGEKDNDKDDGSNEYA